MGSLAARPMKVRIKYVVEDTDRHGNVRLYFRHRKLDRKRRLPGPVGSDAFWKAYHAIKKTLDNPAPPKPRRLDKRSLDYLCHLYFHSAEYRANLSTATQENRRRILARFCNRTDSKDQRFGDKPFARLTGRHLRRVRDGMLDRPTAANNLLKTLRVLFKFAVEDELVDLNPARHVANVRVVSDGHHTWSFEEVRQFEARHPIGTKARLTLALALYTAQRRADIVRLGRQHECNRVMIDGVWEEGDWLDYTQQKNEAKKPVRLYLPIIPQLRRIIDTTPCGNLTYLTTAHDKPFTAKGFGNWFRKRCDEAGLPQHCTVHGLRKNTSALLADMGCTDAEIMAITGHQTRAEVTRYTKGANQKRLAKRAMKAVAENMS